MQLTLETALAFKSALVLAVFVFFAVAERWRPAVESPLLVRLGRSTKEAWRRLTKNVALFGLNALLSPLIVIPITYWASGFSLGLRPDFLDGWWGRRPLTVSQGAILAILLTDYERIADDLRLREGFPDDGAYRA